MTPMNNNNDSQRKTMPQLPTWNFPPNPSPFHTTHNPFLSQPNFTHQQATPTQEKFPARFPSNNFNGQKDKTYDNHINVTVRNENGNKISFTIERDTELSDLIITAHSDRISVDQFLPNGKKVKEKHSPVEVEMEDGKETQVIPTLGQKQDANHINLKINGMTSVDEPETNFKIKKDTQLSNLMTTYCEKQSLDPNGSTRFMYNGKMLQGEETPNKLFMKNGDSVFALGYNTFS